MKPYVVLTFVFLFILVTLIASGVLMPPRLSLVSTACASAPSYGAKPPLSGRELSACLSEDDSEDDIGVDEVDAFGLLEPLLRRSSGTGVDGILWSVV